MALALFGVLSVTASCDSEKAPPPGPAAAPALPPLPAKVGGFRVHGAGSATAGYIDDRACKECHESIWNSYQAVGMANSLAPARAARELPLDQEFHHARTGLRYTMRRRDEGRLVLERYCLDQAGRRFAEHRAEVQWVIGSGNKVRSFLAQNPRGELFHLPVSHYRDAGWQMSPGFDRPGHQRFERMVDRGCMFCHNAYPDVPNGSDLPHQSHRFPKSLPHGIGCQRCHGPGARHAQLAADDDASDQAIRSQIINPARLSPRQREDTCMACHLQPESVRSKMMVRAFDRGVYSWRPGGNLTEFVTYLDHGTAKERSRRFEINHHGYRLRQSKCYTATDGRLSCLTCHDPHRKVAAADRAAFYRAKCMTCHQPEACRSDDPKHTANPRGSDCVACHMAPARPSDVVHATMTDHRIRRGPPDPQRLAPREEEVVVRQPLTVRPYFPDRSHGDPLYPVYEGFGRSYFPTPVSLRMWQNAFERTAPHGIAGSVNVARGLLECGDHRAAIEVLQAAVSKTPNDAPARWTLGSALLAGKQTAAAIRELEAALRADTRDPGIQATLGDAYWQAGRLQDARTIYERALAGRPESALTWRNYGYVLVQLRDFIGALRALRAAIARDPFQPEPYAVAASILHAQRRTAERFEMLEQGRILAPELGLDLAAAKLLATKPPFRDVDGALRLVRTAAAENARNGRSWLHLAAAELIAGDLDQVLPALQRAQQGGADQPTRNLLAGLYWRRKGNPDKAGAVLAPLMKSLDQPRRERLFAQLVAYGRKRGDLK